MKETSNGVKGDESAGGIQVLRRAAAVLHALEERPDGLSLGDIARRTELPRATVQRIVETLAGENFVVGLGEASGVRLGPALIALAAAARNPVADVARPHLAALAQQTGETVDLSSYENGAALFLDQIVGPQRLRAVSAVGKAFALHCSANGKAMLAALDPRALAALKRTKLATFTSHTVTAWPALVGELRGVAASGIAFDREEQSLGISAVGTAFRDPGGRLYAISIPTPTQRFAGRERTLGDALLDCRRRVVDALSGPRAFE